MESIAPPARAGSRSPMLRDYQSCTRSTRMKAGFADRVARAAASIPSKFRPSSAVVLGSGLSGIVEGLGYEELPFSSIAEFPKPTVHGIRVLLPNF